MNDDDQTVAKALLDRAVSSEPPLDMDPQALLWTARRRQSRRRIMVSGSVIVAVAAVAIGAAVLGGRPRAEVPVTPPTSTDVSTDVSTTSVQPPPLPYGDERSRRLTEALASAHIVPPGMTVSPEDAQANDPFIFFRAGPDSYQAVAVLSDSRGHGKVAVNVTGSQPSTDVLSCALLQESLSCTERTFPDGSKARVYTMAGNPGLLRRLTVIRPNGSFLEVYDDNQSPITSGPPSATRDEPPLTDYDLFKVAATPSLAW